MRSPKEMEELIVKLQIEVKALRAQMQPGGLVAPPPLETEVSRESQKPLTQEELKKKNIVHTQIELGSDDEDEQKDETLFDQSTIELASQNDDLLVRLQEVQQ